MSEKNIRFSTNIITFFDSAFLGLEPDLSHAQFAAEFVKNPRHYFDIMLDSAKESGVEGIEFAPDPGGWRAALGVYGSIDGVKTALDDRGLVLSSSYAHGRQLIGNAIENPELEAFADREFAEHAQFLAEFGASTIVSGNLPRSRFGNASPDETATPEDFSRPVAREVHEKFAEQLNRLGDVIRPYGVRIAIHTDAYSVCSRNEDIATVMSLTDPETIQLCPDAGHITLDGGNAVEVLRDNIDRVPTMHWKDCASPLSGHALRGDQKERHSVMLTYFRILGSGIVDWDEWMRILRDNKWNGWAVEEIDNSPDPIGELRQGLEFFESNLAAIYR